LALYDWWLALLKKIQNRVNQDQRGAIDTDNEIHPTNVRELRRIQRQREMESKELLKMSSQFSEPKTFSEFKEHPVYLLERDLKISESLNPECKRVVKLFRGEKVYLQEHKETLRTKTQWRKLLRQVRSAETAFKIIKKRKRGEQSQQGDARSSGEVFDMEIYGIWQTDALIIPCVKEGIIPVNEHGNVEVFDGCEDLVPLGARLIELRTAEKAAKAMNLPFAPALFGFERKGTVVIPKFGGIVVLDIHEEIIRDAAINIFDDQIEKFEVKKEKAILNRWERIVNLVISRQNLKEKYGF